MKLMIRVLLSLLGELVLFLPLVQAQGFPGMVQWSDGHQLQGEISLSPGKQLRLTVDNKVPTSFRLEDVQQIQLIPEKEEMAEGWFFPEAGKTIKEKTGDIYPVRYLNTQITLHDGRILQGHLYTTVLYVEGESNNEKVVLLAKQSGIDGQKLSDLIYPTLIQFTAKSTTASSTRIDLSKSGLVGIKRVVVVSKPELWPLLATETAKGSQIWTVPWGDPAKLLFMAECADGVHLACPPEADPDCLSAIQSSFSVMEDFYNERRVEGVIHEPEDEDLYSFVLMQRTKHSVDGSGAPLPGNEIPWDVAVLRWKYDATTKKTTLLNRIQLTMGRANGQTELPLVAKDSSLLKAVSLDSGAH